mgnify:CR=1 FL=1
MTDHTRALLVDVQNDELEGACAGVARWTVRALDVMRRAGVGVSS